ncbi:peptidase domain-containing ABC transporter [Ferrimonas aestuarii]|uniref:Peptidase domain-containing ABC transporter n=1 Tax=Ferrimonas aestuarii TaxID=2569539 RepID=A0A4U1BN44_9GAMM|nr:peptidase domain-containing ABC transporter [Ferrimonas aestuarii]TKB55333.1 peptidase domain-containing ABC transporter [Ferrimonas aestuarii]
MSELLDKLSFSSRKRLPVILQSEGAECGLACLCMIANYHGHKLDLFTLRKSYPISLKGANLKQLIGIAAKLNLVGRPIKAALEDLPKLATPVILHWDLNHFVVLKKVVGNKVIIHDPGKGLVKLSMDEVSKSFTGIALELRPSENFQPKDEQLKLSLNVLWRNAVGLKRSLGQILLLSFLLQLLLLVSPYFVQLIVDNVVVSRDLDFLFVLGIGFSLVLLIQVATKAFRSWIVLYFQSTLGIQLVANLFKHLLRLPMSWFGKRFTGDILSRFQSLDFIKKLLSEGFVESVVDGVMTILTVVMMLILSPGLALISIVAVLTYSAVRLGIYPAMRNHTKESLQYKASADGLFYEAIRTVQPVKVFNGESIQQSKMENANATWMNSEIKLGRLTIAYNTFKELLYGAEYLALLWLGAYLVIAESITVGVLFAFLAYRQQFATSSQMLLEKLFEWKMLGIHLSRVADIALEDQEAHLDSQLPVPQRPKGRIELKNLSFRYSDNEPYLFENLSLTIEPGECVVLTAPSGFGKTTLMKIMMGLMPPTSGTISFDGVDIHTLGLSNYRSMISAVMQGDHLLSGSIGDNISFFSIDQDLELLESVAQDAHILDDINAMPMGFHSLAGDMGSTLSGGQIQRVLLARAMYKQPKVLFLDEASSALDVDTERRINGVLKGLGMTRIMIAHRVETINMADRIIDLTQPETVQKTNNVVAHTALV